MFRIAATSVFLFCLCALGAASINVLYVAEPQGNQYSLLTYNVNPKTAVATQVGQAITINANAIDPLTINRNHFLYVWNATDAWVYATDQQGVPNGTALQHLTFGYSHAVTTFLADPDGKYAYAALTWFDPENNSYASIILLTIDQSTGKLTNTGQTVASYGPSEYIPLYTFLFGKAGSKLFARWYDDGPHTSAFGYDYYPVNQKAGSLGKLKSLYYAQTWECSTSCDVTITSTVSAASGACCGPGSGLVTIAENASGQNFECEYELPFCSDDVDNLFLDPGGRNLVFGDSTTQQTFAAHIDFPGSQLTLASTTIPGTPQVYFSPDSRLLYTVKDSTIGVYAFQPKTGDWTANTSLEGSGIITIATATLK